MAKRGTTKFESNIQEKRVAEEIGGKVQIASGSLWFADSDCRSDKFLVECKTTSKHFYAVTSSVWHKICKEAGKDGARTPVMCIELLNDSSYPPSYAVLNLKDVQHVMRGMDVKNSLTKDMKSFRVLASSPPLLSVKFSEYEVLVMRWSNFLSLKEGI